MKKMWMVAVLAVMCVVSVRAQEARVMDVSAPQVKDELFAGTEKFAAGAKDVTELNMDPNAMSMAGNGNPLAKKMQFMVIRSYSYDKPGMYRQQDVDVYRQKLQDGTWSCFVHVVESKTGESTDICSRQSADKQTSEMVIMAVEPKGLTFIHMKGNMSLEDLKHAGDAARGVGKQDK